MEGFDELGEALKKCQDAEGLYYLGNTAYREKDTSGAEKWYEASLGISEYAAAHNNYGVLLSDMGPGRYGDVEGHYVRALEIREENAEAHNNYGTLLFGIGPERYGDAEEHYVRALEIRGEDAEMMANLGMLLLNQKTRIDEGREWLKKAWDLRDRLPEGRAKDFFKDLVKKLGLE